MRDCVICDGAGKIELMECPKCEGKGQTFHFIGDWAELADLWELPMNEDDNELAKSIGDYITSHYNEGIEILHPRVRQDMEDFLDALIKADTWDKPVFEGVKAIEHDWTFVTYFKHNLQLMWT